MSGLNDERPPSGLVGRNKRRFSDEETERRMLRTAMEMVHSTGLTVSLDHISFEDVIRDAAVSRSAVYRRWPYKDLFFSDLLKELARAATPTTIDDDGPAELARQAVLPHLDDGIRTPERRHMLLTELLRQTAQHDFDAIHGSTQWRTYLALHAIFLSLTDGQLRDDVQAALAESERAFITRIAAPCEQLTTLLGYRLRPELGATFQTLASLATAALRGLSLMAVSTPHIATQRLHTGPFGTTPAEWSHPALGVASIALAFVEPDPTIEWDDDRAAAIRAALTG